MTFSRQSRSDLFIKSLALSDVLCSLISLPIFVAEMFVDIFKTDLQCQIVRYIVLFFPVVTVVNYFVFGIEKYMSVYHPFNLPTSRIYKRVVRMCWVIGGLMTIIAIPAYSLVRYDLDNNIYTQVCKYDKTIKSKRRMFISFALIVYILPSVILTAINVRLATFLRRLRRISPHSNPRNTQSTLQRAKIIRMFLSLVFAFFFPYIIWIFYGGATMVLELEISFTADYISRYISGALVFINGLTGSTILFINHSYLRGRLVGLVSRFTDQY